VADVNGVVEIQVCRHRGEIVGVVIHIVAVAGLGGSPVAAPVVGDDAVAVQRAGFIGVPSNPAACQDWPGLGMVAARCPAGPKNPRTRR
jgi:hypothetical protein